MDDKSKVNLPQDGVVLRNLKGAMYKLGVKSLGESGRVTSMTSLGNLVFIALANSGIRVFRIDSGQIKDVTKLDVKMTCYDMATSDKLITYIKEENSKCAVCVHKLQDVLDGKQQPLRTMDVNRRAPMVIDFNLELLILGCSAWSVSWTGGGDEAKDTPEVDESHLRSLCLKTFSTVREWKACENSVSLLRRQTTPDHNMLGVVDSRAGLRVYDLRQPTDNDYTCLYHVPVEEIRNFHLVGNFVAVFHKFEPNVTFWNMKEQKTILCINIQDQLRELAEEFLEDEEEDAGLFGDDDDHVTSVTCIRSDDDHVLMYGTKSGCIFGMSVNNRTKLFNIPCPHEMTEPSTATTHRRDVQGIRFIPEGKVVVSYEKYGLTMLDFSPENPPDRPPTRCQRRDTNVPNK